MNFAPSQLYCILQVQVALQYIGLCRIMMS